MLSFSEMFIMAGFSYLSYFGATGVFIGLLPHFHKYAKLWWIGNCSSKIKQKSVIFFKLYKLCILQCLGLQFPRDHSCLC